MANPKLRVDVNHNPTKKGIKVQFVMPQTVEGDAKAEMTQKLQAKLNQGLAQYNLTVSQDTDVPYANVIGFLIPIADVKLMIKNAISGGTTAPSTPEAPAPEEPVTEIARMQELAGISKNNLLEAEKDPAFKAAHELNPKAESWDAFLLYYNGIRVGAIISFKVAKTNSDKKIQKKIWDAIDKPALVQKVKDIAQTEDKWEEIYSVINKEVANAAAKVGT